MILNRLNHLRDDNNAVRKLYLSSDLAERGLIFPVAIGLHNNADKQQLAVCYTENGNDTYFLPWKDDTGFYIDLPKNAPQALIFLTSELSGCFVGVQDMGDFYRIRHYNFMTVNVDVNDLQRFDGAHHLINWLAPNRDNLGQMLTVARVPHELYTGYSKKIPVVFWGEYINNDWVFYYQATDNTVHRFLVF